MTSLTTGSDHLSAFPYKRLVSKWNNSKNKKVNLGFEARGWRNGGSFNGGGSCRPPTPLTRIRTGKRERALQFGLSFTSQASFEGNQSFPRYDQRRSILDRSIDLNSFPFNKFKGDELNSFSFSGNPGKGSAACTPDSGMIYSLSASESLSNCRFPNSDLTGITFLWNPNKAVLTFDVKTMQILMANDVAIDLFGYGSEGLCSRRLDQLFSRLDRDVEALSEDDFKCSGEIVVVSGRVVDAICCSNIMIPVSVWMRRLGSVSGDERCVAVIEPVRRIKGEFIFDGKGVILCCDSTLVNLYGFTNSNELEGCNIYDFIPALNIPERDLTSGEKLPKEFRKQRITGRNKDGSNFPLCIQINREFDFFFVSPPASRNCAVKSRVEPLDFTTNKQTTDLESFSSLACEVSLSGCRSNLSLEEETTSDGFEDRSRPSLEVINVEEEDEGERVYRGVVSVFANISGMITILNDGTIHSCNHYFALTLFGYSQNQLVGKNICDLIPSFYDDAEFLDSAMDPLYEDGVFVPEFHSRSDKLHVGGGGDDDDDEEEEAAEVVAATATTVSTDVIDVVVKNLANDFNLTDNDDNRDTKDYLSSMRAVPLNELDNGTEADVNGNSENETCDVEIESCRLAVTTSDSSRVSDFKCPAAPMSTLKVTKETKEFKTSTPCESPVKSKLRRRQILEGGYFGLGRHKDGSDLAIVYQVRLIEFDNGQSLHCIWIMRDNEEPGECTNFDHSCSMTATTSVEQMTTTDVSTPTATHIPFDLSCQSIDSMVVGDVTEGMYSEHYRALKQIGRGGFGCVMFAHRVSDGCQVVTKFIKKSKVYKECWVYDALLQKVVPLEVSLLKTISHPNIIKVLDVYENDDYFQMVMEKHGYGGMDLFEFIDRSQNVDEPLASYIFRQVVSAVSYLHGLNILHRDVKDENVVLDEHFTVKLIDFGSAAFMSDTRTFSSFCGTVEYCSPEVLQGEKYRGPELEMWSLGVTLYTLVYGENPFYDIDETILAILRPPFVVSDDLFGLISHLLHIDPVERCTMRDLENHSWILQPVDINDYRFEDVVGCFVPKEVKCCPNN